MMLELDFSLDVPIYLQIRNQIVLGIADGRLAAGEKLPTIRALANETGINMMTASKAYALLKQEGYIQADRRSGAVVCEGKKGAGSVSVALKHGLKLLIAEAALSGVARREFLQLVIELYAETGVEK